MAIKYYMYMYMKQNSIHFYSYSGNRAPQNLMTTVPEKVWTGAKVPYNLDANISEYAMKFNSLCGKSDGNLFVNKPLNYPYFSRGLTLT